MKVRVFFTVDVEIWCNGWNHLDTNFPDAFKRYVYGPTAGGECGLTRTLDRLNDHGLQGVFFVEPLFSRRFGPDPLAEIVGLIRDAGQEVQLHLHTEWADETVPPLIPDMTAKRQFLHMFDRGEQALLIRTGLDLLRSAGADQVNAFRAGSFGMNAETWRALNDVGIPFDSSYNGLMTPPLAGSEVSGRAHQPKKIDGIWEYPMTLFLDATGRCRHAQLGACSYAELEWLLWQAAEGSWDSVVLLSHNFELMNQRKSTADPVVNRRFERFCRFLQRNTDTFETHGFVGLVPPEATENPPPPQSSMPVTVGRLVEQAWRRVYR